MADLLADIKSYFVANSIMDRIELDSVSEEADTCIVLYEYTGSTNIIEQNTPNRSIQIVVRGLDAVVIRQKAFALYALLISTDNILSLTADRWSMVYLRQTPFRIKMDEKQRVYYGFNAGFTTYID